jgi:hypothetical protein
MTLFKLQNSPHVAQLRRGSSIRALEPNGSRARREAQQLSALSMASLASVPKKRAVGDPY